MARIKAFETEDWVRYTAWIGTIFSLLLGTSFFVIWSASQGVEWPGYVWNIPIGTGLFVFALAIDDIGHRTVYKQDLKKGEAYVHQMIVITAVGSVMALCLGYAHPETMRMPALGLILLSLFYSAIDEALHWHRYLTKGLDRVEMWSHFVAIAGHVIMISSWWQWYDNGYVGVAKALEVLPW
jgi:hypothetical protein